MSYFSNSIKLAKQLNGVTRKKYVQELKTIKYLYLNGPKTTTEICRSLKISAPNSINLINELINSEMIEKKGLGPSIGGRKPDLYALKENSFYVMAIEMGRYTTKIAIFNNENHNITDTISYDIPIKAADKVKTLNILHQHAEDLIKSSGIDRTKLLGIGLVMPGLVNSKKGKNYTHLNIEDSSIKEYLEKKFKIPVFIENIAKAIALAEFRFGLAKGKHNVLVISLNWGIGLGMILDNKLFKGSTGFSSEFSHIPMIENGELCPCGKTGCLETIASGFTLVKLAKKGIEENKSLILNNLVKGDPEALTPEIVLEAVLKGDQYSMNILSNVGFNLGKGIAILIQLINPEMIILGGVFANAKQYLTVPIQQSLNIHCMQQLCQETKIELSELGKDVGILGAIAVSMENVFDNMMKTSTA